MRPLPLRACRVLASSHGDGAVLLLLLGPAGGSRAGWRSCQGRAALGHPPRWLPPCGGCGWQRWPCVTSAAGPANICFMTDL